MHILIHESLYNFISIFFSGCLLGCNRRSFEYRWKSRFGRPITIREGTWRDSRGLWRTAKWKQLSTTGKL